MKISNKFVSKLLIVAFTLTVLIQAQQLESMEIEKQVICNNQDIQIYRLLSSISEGSPFWLPADIIRHIAINTHTITGLLSSLNLENCSEQFGLFYTTKILNRLYPTYLSMPAALLKICLNDDKVSLLKVRGGWNFSSFNPPTIFDFCHCYDDFDLISKTLCQVVDKKAFVDCFKERDKYGYKQKRLHVFILEDFNVESIESYLGVFLDYAQNCPEKSKGVLNILKAKNGEGHTALYLAERKGKIKIAVAIKDTIEKLEQNIPKKEHCLIQ